jgi:nicotinamide riboside transporter PnuC
MKFNVWQRKLKERVDVWYLARQDEELQMVSAVLYIFCKAFNEQKKPMNYEFVLFFSGCETDWIESNVL